MATNFPTGLDNFTNPTPTDTLNTPSHAEQHANANDAIEAIETLLGANGGTIYVEVAKRLNPVGTIREFNVPTNPAELLGFGTWQAYGAGRTTVAIDTSQTEFDTVGKMGGAKTVYIDHTHSGTTGSIGAFVGNFKFAAGGTNIDHLHTFTTGAMSANPTPSILQPYIVVYRWIRTA